MSKLKNHVRALPPSAFFLARTATCLRKASLDRVKPFLWFFSTMSSEELQSVSEMEQIMSYLRTLDPSRCADGHAKRAIAPAEPVRSPAEGGGGRVSKSDFFPFSTSSSESFNGRLTFSPLFLPFVEICARLLFFMLLKSAVLCDLRLLTYRYIIC